MKKHLNTLLLFIIMIFSNIALSFEVKSHGKLVFCQSAVVGRVGKVCTIRVKSSDYKIMKGDIVAAYNKNGYWRSAGYVYSYTKPYIVVIFEKNVHSPDRNGFFRISSIFDNFDWESSFDKNYWF